MIVRENCKDFLFFWKERIVGGRKEYFNIVINYVIGIRFKCVFGGILVDDMGFGKILEVILFIVINFYDGKLLVILVNRKFIVINVFEVIM